MVVPVMAEMLVLVRFMVGLRASYQTSTYDSSWQSIVVTIVWVTIIKVLYLVTNPFTIVAS